MTKIHELDPSLANQIAAGEVVERPASVIKELVENALDAGSTQIEIFVEEAGLRKMEVIDNGTGIEPDDVKNAFKRHATSKIYSKDDLFRIRTLGFRGEALPSIASVSHVTLETSTGQSAGSLLKLEGGKIVSHQPCSMRKGTRISVENLFYNTPARLKYVKTLQTELANIGDIVNRLAMSHPKVAFRLVHEGNSMLVTRGTGDLKQAIAGIYGVANAKKMLSVQGKDLDFEIKGFVSRPELTRASRNYLSLVINGRYVKNFILNKAIIEGYGSKLMVGRYPIAVIEMTMDPLLVDVNVHPTKQEVRLSKEKELCELLIQVIRQALQVENLIPSVGENMQFKRSQPITGKQMYEQGNLIPQTKNDPADQRTVANTNKEKNSVQSTKLRQAGGLAYDAQEGRFYVPEMSTVRQKPAQNLEQLKPVNLKPIATMPEFKTVDGVIPDPEVFADPFSEKGTHLLAEEQQNYATTKSTDCQSSLQVEKRAMPSEQIQPSKQRFPELEYFGQMHGTYLFAQNEKGLYIVDQHAAQERIKYEYYRKKIGEVGEAKQTLLVPIVLEYPNSDCLKIQEGQSLLEKAGIYLEAFGQNSFIFREHPVWFNAGEEEETLKSMIDMLLKNGRLEIAEFREATAIMMSCKRSIKANHHLDKKQARQLLEDLATCENPFNCPHGRPVLVHLNNQDMEKMFKRIQDPH